MPGVDHPQLLGVDDRKVCDVSHAHPRIGRGCTTSIDGSPATLPPVQNRHSRRRFLGVAGGLGAATWLAPSITTVDAAAAATTAP